MLIYKPFASLTSPKLCLLPSLFAFFGKPKTSLIFCHDHALPNIVLRVHLYIFLCCFTFPPCPHALLHPSTPICTHLHPSLALFVNPPKTSCPGKFPRPYRDQSMPYTPFMSLLAFFVSPPMPLCPNAPIRTHPHPFAPVFTRVHPSFHVYMYNLIEKNYQNDI